MSVKVSIMNGEYIYWSDLSDRGAEVFEITEEQFANIEKWLWKIVDGEYVDIVIEKKPLTNDELTEIKKQEMESLISLHYPLETRLQYMTNWIINKDDTNFVDMNSYINGIKAEFADNGKDADFTERE